MKKMVLAVLALMVMAAVSEAAPPRIRVAPSISGGYIGGGNSGVYFVPGAGYVPYANFNSTFGTYNFGPQTGFTYQFNPYISPAYYGYGLPPYGYANYSYGYATYGYGRVPYYGW